MKRSGRVSRLMMKGNVYMDLMEEREGKKRVENQDTDGRISLKGILKNTIGSCGLD
jgi:hypothetical protein